jgi:antitoxin component YwqK of YwqJK toxin-antitoxin module
MKNLNFTILIFTIILFCSLVQADVLKTTSGTIFEGTILEETEEKVVIDVKGSSTSYLRDEIVYSIKDSDDAIISDKSNEKENFTNSVKQYAETLKLQERNLEARKSARKLLNDYEERFGSITPSKNRNRFKRTVVDGVFRSYYPDGSIHSELYKRDKISKEYYPNGQLKVEVNFSDNENKLTKHYSKDGKEIIRPKNR